jgi:DNA-directed RNA polymerase subunit K/omega
MRGAPPLVDLWTNDLAEIALREVLGGKIELAMPEIGPEDTL